MIPQDNAPTTDGASDGLLRKPELARKLSISKRTLDAWMRERRVPFLKVGKTVRFRLSDVLQSLNRFRVH